MIKNLSSIIAICLISFVVYRGIKSIYITKSSVIGSYVNNNTFPVLEGPKPIDKGFDTLTLKADNTFESKTWGNGTYRIEPSIFETRIHLEYYYTYGKAGYSTYVTTPLFGNNRIWLNSDLNFYFEKIK